MTKTISVSNKTHKKIKQDATDEEMTIKDFVENKLGLILIATMLSIGGLGLAYAEQVDLPLPQVYDDSWCVFLSASNHVTFTCNWKWFLPDYVMAEINQTEVPTSISLIPQHNADLAEMIKHFIEKGIPEKEIPKISEPENNIPKEPLTREER